MFIWSELTNKIMILFYELSAHLGDTHTHERIEKYFHFSNVFKFDSITLHKDIFMVGVNSIIKQQFIDGMED